jgi:hypothetical protein
VAAYAILHSIKTWSGGAWLCKCKIKIWSPGLAGTTSVIDKFHIVKQYHYPILPPLRSEILYPQNGYHVFQLKICCSFLICK